MRLQPNFKQIIGTIALCVIPFSPLLAAPSKENTIKPQSNLKSPKYSTTPFNLGAERLPRNYHGHDILQIFQKIRVPREKGEFERTEEYEKRLAKWKASPIIGTVTPDDTLAIELHEPLAPETFSIRYDADREELTASIDLIFCTQSVSSTCLETYHHEKREGTYIGKTAMGVKFRVTSHTVTSVILGLSQHPSTSTFSFPISVPRDEAIGLKPSLRAYAIVTLADPYKIRETGTKTASLSDPDEYLWNHLGLHVNLKAIWVVDKKTGEVLVKGEIPL